jgi:hypothetical protein
VTGVPYFFGGKPLIRGGKPAMAESCCCGEDECCCGPCLKFRFTIEGVTDGGTCADCVDANGTYITGEIAPNIVDGVCTYETLIIPLPNPLAACEDAAFELVAKITCPVDGQIRLEASVQIGIILLPPVGPGDPPVSPDPHFYLDTLYDGDCFAIDEDIPRSGTLSNVCGLIGATARIEVIACDAVLPQGITATSVLEGTLSASAAAAGGVSGTSVLTGRTAGDASLDGDVSGTSSMIGSLTASAFAGGDVSGVSEATGDISAFAFASGPVAATSKTIGAGKASAACIGDVSGASKLTGRAAGDAELSGSIEAVGTASGVLSAAGTVAGGAIATSVVTGTLAGAASVTGAIFGTPVVTGDLTAAALAEGDISGTSLLSGAVSAILAASGSVSGASILTGVLTASGGLSGDISGTSVLTGRLAGDAGLSGDISGASALTGDATAEAYFDAELLSTSEVEGDATAEAYFDAELLSTSEVEGDATAEAYFGAELLSTTVVTGALESCCCGDCIRFRYTISGLANNSCNTCNDYNTDNDSPDVNPDESCVYAAQWQSSDCNGQNIVFNAELVCDDDGNIRLSGTVQDTAIIGPLIDPPNGPTPTNDIMSGTDTFTLGTPCTDLEITLSRDTGSQTTCDFDNATVVLKVIDCPSGLSVIERMRRKSRKKTRRNKALPVVCQHRGELLGDADCGCSGKPKVYHCTLLGKPCTPKSVGKPIVRIKGGPRIESPQACSVCDHFAP